MYIVRPTSKFRKDLKRAAKRGYNPELLTEVIKILSSDLPLDKKYNDHALSGEYDGCRECHISPDWLLVYQIAKKELVLILMRTGTHSDLFD